MLKSFIKSIIACSWCIMLFSCENSIKEVQEISFQDSLPLVTAYNIVYERTDSGYLQIVLKSPLMYRYEENDNYAIFPEGFEVTFYDTTAKPLSYIRADYGISYEKKKLMKARNDVVVLNYKTEEQLNTENLVWDQRKKTIVANTFIKITTPDKVIYGDSLHAHESFKSRTIYNMTAEIEVEEENDSIK